MTEFIGRSDNHLLFSDAEKTHGVIVDSRVSLVVTSGDFSTLESAEAWGDGEFSATDQEIASTVLASLENPDPEPTGRMYTVPRGVQLNARKALTAASDSEGPVARYIGTLLAAGGQISFNELGILAEYFSNTEEEDSTAWRLHGGLPAKKWVTPIFEREALTASAPKAPENLAQILEENPEAGPEFLVRISSTTGIMDRLYRIDLDKRTYVWDASAWTDLGQTEWDIWDYDFALDGKHPRIDQTHIMIDPESALHAATLISKGITTFTVEDISPVETALALDALAEEDWAFIDSITAAGTPGGADGDGIYSEEERSANASKQVRDGRGQFAKMGSTVMINGNPQQTGLISRVNGANGTVEVTLPDGNKVTVPGNQVEAVTEGSMPAPGNPLAQPRVDFSGILAEPRTPVDRKVAQLPGTLPQMTRGDLKQIIDNFPAWVKKQRDSFRPTGSSGEVQGEGTSPSRRASTGRSVDTEAYSHPLLTDWLKKKASKATYRPLTAAAVEKPVELSPETSDVEPVYMAIVSPDDPRAVFKLISLVPANSKSNQPMVYSREEGEWKRDEATLGDLKSATPPPVVALDESTLDDVLVQVDGTQGAQEEAPMAAEPVAVPTEPDAGSVTASADEQFALMVLWGPNKNIMEQALVAAGGADRNRGGAEKLRRYWLHGEGAAKIRWGTPGDWTRCFRNLSKYLGPRARGYCALRHKEATGMYTGDKEHRQKFSSNTAIEMSSTDVLKDTDAIIAAAFQNARAEVLRERVITASAASNPLYTVYPDGKEGYIAAMTAGAAGEISMVGGKFLIPLVIPEELESGDGREVERYALDTRNLPLPLMWQIQTGEGHNGAVVVGRIDSMGRTPQGIGMAMGYFDVGPYGREAERMVRAGMLRHVSADMDKFEAEAEEAAEKKPGAIAKQKLSIKKARVMGATIVAKPAFQECTIEMAPLRELTLEDDVLPDGIITEEADPMEAVALVAAGYIADAIPVVPPRDWFNDPKLDRPTPLTVDDNGRVFGHVAAWGTAHMNAALGGVNPPRSASGYAYFNKGVIRTDDGTDVTVGQLTLVGGHADLHFSANEAVKHYDDTASAFADVHAGEDRHGIWVAGALRPGVTAQQVRAIRASTPSGDWRPIRGKLELIAVCQVNVPGFPIARAMVASGHTMALTAAGASELARLRPDPILDLARRVQDLEAAGAAVAKEAQVDEALVASLMERVGSHKARRDAELSAKADAITARMETFGYVSKKSRDAAAEKGEALPDGSYPIRNESDLKNAIKAYGRAKESERAKVRKHIMKRARALGKADLIPEDWKNAASAAITASLMSMRERVEAARNETALVASVEDDLKKLSPAERQRLINSLRAKGEEIPEDLAPKAEGADPARDQPAKYKPGYQPRDYNGQFKQVLARLKEDLGDEQNSEIANSIEAIGKGAGDYAESVRAGLELKSHLDRLDKGALNSDQIGNVREASRDLGRAISNLPLPFDNQAAKMRFSDIPPTLRDLMDDLVKRVHDKIGSAEGQKATAKLRSFMSGGDMFSQAEISREMSRFLRLLT
jgi:hypothetical protein